MKLKLTSIIALIIALTAYGETPADSVKVYFRVGDRQFDPNYRDNGAKMDSFIIKVKEAKANDNIDYIKVTGCASPEGNSKTNESLASLRCEEIAAYIENHSAVTSNLIETRSLGVGWNELRDMVTDNPEVPSREKVLYILDNIPLWIYGAEGKIVDGRKKRLMDLKGGAVWNWMQSNIFPELRNSIAVVLYLKNPDLSFATKISEESDLTDKSDLSDKSEVSNSSGLSEQPDLSAAADSLMQSLSGRIVDFLPEKKSFYMAIKTNMLYDAALIPNLGAEFYVGKNISIYGNWMYAWWNKENTSHHWCWETYGGELGARWWLGKKAHAKPLTGHHIGLYAGALIFDFEWGDTGYMGGKPGGTLWDKCLITGGIEYGYSYPIGKRFNIDFTIGLGYIGGNYIKYYPFDNDHYREKEYNLRYFGPTKAEISLVWLLGRGNTNKRKGGGE